MLFWLALAVFVVAPAAALFFAVRRGLETWRAFKQVARGAGLREGLTPLAPLQPAGGTSILSWRPTGRERRPRDVRNLTYGDTRR